MSNCCVLALAQTHSRFLYWSIACRQWYVRSQPRPPRSTGRCFSGAKSCFGSCRPTRALARWDCWEAVIPVTLNHVFPVARIPLLNVRAFLDCLLGLYWTGLMPYSAQRFSIFSLFFSFYFGSCGRLSCIGGGSIYKVGGPDAERRRCQRNGEGLTGGVINL